MIDRRIREILREVAAHPELMTSFVHESAQVFGATHCALVSMHTSHASTAAVTTFSGDPSVLLAYERYYAAISPWRTPIFRLAEGQVATDVDLCPHSEFKQSEFYFDFGKKFGVVRTLGAIVEKSETTSTFISLDRAETDHPYSPAAGRLLAGLRADIQRAVALSRAKEELGILRSALDDVPYPIGILDNEGRLHYANRRFEDVFRNYFSLSRNGVLSALPPNGETFRRVLARTTATELPAELTARDGARISVLPNRNRRATIGIRFASPNKQTVELLRLTPAETRLLERLLLDSTLVNAAASLGIATSTAKTQLRSIFSKTGCNSQKELILHLHRLR